MTDRLCAYPDREEALVAYLYEDMAGEERTAFERHLDACETCSLELEALGSVRIDLGRWTPPEPARQVLPFPSAPPPVRQGFWSGLRTAPVWAQAVAAVLVLGVSAGAANLRIAHDAGGWSVRTGWMGMDAPVAPVASVPPIPAAVPVAAKATDEPVATRAELVALERQLRDEIDTVKSVGPTVVRQTRTLIDESERRQQNELALRIGTMAQDLRAQREADNAVLNRWVGSFRTSADREAKLTREIVQSLAVRVSQQR